MSGLPLLSLLIAVPLIAAALCLFVTATGARWIALVATLLDFALSIDLWAKYDPDGSAAESYRELAKEVLENGR